MNFFPFFSLTQDFSNAAPAGGTPNIDQAGLELRDISASASPLLGLKACATRHRWVCCFFELKNTVEPGMEYQL